MRAAAADAGAFAADAGGAMVLFFDGKRAVRIARVYGIIKRTIPEKGGPGHEQTTDFS